MKIGKLIHSYIRKGTKEMGTPWNLLKEMPSLIGMGMKEDILEK